MSASSPSTPGACQTVLKQAADAGIVVVTHEGASQPRTRWRDVSLQQRKYGAFIMDNLAQAMGEEGVYTTMVDPSPTPPTDGRAETSPGGEVPQDDAGEASASENPRAATVKPPTRQSPQKSGHSSGASPHSTPGTARIIRRTRPQGQGLHRRHARRRPDRRTAPSRP